MLQGGPLLHALMQAVTQQPPRVTDEGHIQLNFTLDEGGGWGRVGERGWGR